MAETKFPLTLIGVAVVIYIGFGVATAGPVGGVITVFFLLLQALITSVLGLAACFLVAQIFSTYFGTLRSASVKLVAVALFPPAAGLLIALISPIIGALAVIVLFFGLLQSLFELELFEVIVFTLALLGVSALAEQAILWIQSMAT